MNLVRICISICMVMILEMGCSTHVVQPIRITYPIGYTFYSSSDIPKKSHDSLTSQILVEATFYQIQTINGKKVSVKLNTATGTGHLARKGIIRTAAHIITSDMAEAAMRGFRDYGCTFTGRIFTPREQISFPMTFVGAGPLESGLDLMYLKVEAQTMALAERLSLAGNQNPYAVLLKEAPWGYPHPGENIYLGGFTEAEFTEIVPNTGVSEPPLTFEQLKSQLEGGFHAEARSSGHKFIVYKTRVASLLNQVPNQKYARMYMVMGTALPGFSGSMATNDKGENVGMVRFKYESAIGFFVSSFEIIKFEKKHPEIFK